MCYQAASGFGFFPPAHLSLSLSSLYLRYCQLPISWPPSTLLSQLEQQALEAWCPLNCPVAGSPCPKVLLACTLGNLLPSCPPVQQSAWQYLATITSCHSHLKLVRAEESKSPETCAIWYQSILLSMYFMSHLSSFNEAISCGS